jgi:hypothetical protein
MLVVMSGDTLLLHDAFVEASFSNTGREDEMAEER